MRSVTVTVLGTVANNVQEPLLAVVELPGTLEFVV